MANIRSIIADLSAREKELRRTEFLAPCVQSGSVRTRIRGLVYTLAPQPRNFEGWGIFRPVDSATARLVEEASLPRVDHYLRLLSSLRVRLARRVGNAAWLAYPANESDMRQRFGSARPIVVHLVMAGNAFDQVTVACDGGAWWFSQLDHRADPIAAERLRDAFAISADPGVLDFPGMTPEMRAAYQIALTGRMVSGAGREQQDEVRLRAALRMGGGTLDRFADQGEFWLVEWRTADGEEHYSAIGKSDLTVISSGICLDGRDRDFDLQSLVGVMEMQ
jgi:hypothetical protein